MDVVGEHIQMGCGSSRLRGTRYEAFVKDTNKSIEEASRAITNKTEEKATAEADKTAAEEDKNSAMNEQQQNQNENADLHKACDFTLNNFEVPMATDVTGGLGSAIFWLSSSTRPGSTHFAIQSDDIVLAGES